MSKRRVVVTGLGAVTPIGNTVEDFWAGIREGKVGIGPTENFAERSFFQNVYAGTGWGVSVYGYETGI